MKQLDIRKFRKLRHRWDFIETIDGLPDARGWVSDNGMHVGLFHKGTDGMDDNERNVRINVLKELHHPNINTVVDYHQKGHQFIVVSKYCAVKSLAERLAKEGPFSEKLVIDIVGQFLKALECVHARTMIHGRLNLENILYGVDSGVKLVGITHIHEGGAWGAKGYPRFERYLPPEYFMFDQYDIRSEVYVVGVILIELLTGERWLHTVPDDKVAAYCAAKNYKIPRSVPESTTEKLIGIINRCLEVDPDMRYQTIGELRLDFQSRTTKKLSDHTAQVDPTQKGNTYYRGKNQESSSPMIDSSIGLVTFAGKEEHKGIKSLSFGVLLVNLMLLLFIFKDLLLVMPTAEDLDICYEALIELWEGLVK